MKTVALAVAAMLLTTTAWGEWVLIGKSYEDNKKGDDIYIDPARIIIDGNIRRTWVLINFSRMAPGRMPSGTDLTEFDCKQSKQRRLSAFLYHGPRPQRVWQPLMIINRISGNFRHRILLTKSSPNMYAPNRWNKYPHEKDTT